jgi:triacylglycerol lipase
MASPAEIPVLLRGAVVESVWTLAHAVLWPFGFVASWSDPRLFSPIKPAPSLDGTSTPVLLVHGIIDNHSIFALLRRTLHQRGFGEVRTMNYSLLTNDVPTAAAQLGQYVELLCTATGHRRIQLVGHSLGGLIARYYVQRLGGDARVKLLVTLGTPHGGSYLANLIPLRLGRQLRPGSALLSELALPAPHCRTRMVAVYSPVDQVVIPGRNGRIDHPDLRARNVAVPAVGHQSLLFHPRVIDAVTKALGNGATAGV